jgi:hypothetical protein
LPFLASLSRGNKLPKSLAGAIFELEEKDNKSFVIRRDRPGSDRIPVSISIGIVGTAIAVIDGMGTDLFEAKVVLNDDGRNMLRVQSLELEPWELADIYTGILSH